MQEIIEKIDPLGTYKVAEVAELANVPTDTVYNYIRNNRSYIEENKLLIYVGGIERKRYLLSGELAREIVAKSFSSIPTYNDMKDGRIA